MNGINNLNKRNKSIKPNNYNKLPIKVNKLNHITNFQGFHNTLNSNIKLQQINFIIVKTTINLNDHLRVEINNNNLNMINLIYKRKLETEVAIILLMVYNHNMKLIIKKWYN
jgi:hypothetical protein